VTTLATRRVLLVALVAAVIALVLLSNSLHANLLELIATAQRLASVHPVAAALLVILFAAASAMLVFVSTAVVAPFLVYTWGSVGALALLWGGWFLGGICAYAIGRYLGRPVVHRLAAPALLEHYERWVSARMPFRLVLLFQLALPSELPGYLLGLVRFSFPRYCMALALAELPYAVATVLLGAGLVERRLGLLIPVGAAAVLLSATTLAALHRRLAARPAE
jgi:uncharacterized membrane protein YdjX (TVP38/TMEM64 family)